MPYKDPSKHREAHAAATARWRKNNPERHKVIQNRSNRKAQGCLNATGETKGGPCEICGNVYPVLDYDHDHATGQFRGWLCRWCNIKLGWFEKWKTQIESYLGKVSR
jgi:hypothetical protein